MTLTRALLIAREGRAASAPSSLPNTRAEVAPVMPGPPDSGPPAGPLTGVPSSSRMAKWAKRISAGNGVGMAMNDLPAPLFASVSRGDPQIEVREIAASDPCSPMFGVQECHKSRRFVAGDRLEVRDLAVAEPGRGVVQRG